jgi:hypothetical protein
VRARFAALLGELGRRFDGRIEGINFAESAVDFEEHVRFRPPGFTFTGYRDALLANLAAAHAVVPTGIAFQDGNAAAVDPTTSRTSTVDELVAFARDELGVAWIFWGTEEPFYSSQLLPWLAKRAAAEHIVP